MSGRRVHRRALGTSLSEASARPLPRRVAVALLAALALAAAAVSIAIAVAGSGSAHAPLPASRSAGRATGLLDGGARARHLAGALASPWKAAARVGGQPAAWLWRHARVTMMRFDQRLVHLVLHAGSSDGGTIGWAHGDSVVGAEVHRLLAAINGGFKLTYRDVGFMSGGRVAVPLKAGLASIVTYSDGSTNIGAWDAGVPSRRKTVFSVLQNQRLLVDHGVRAATVSDCIIKCWGGTVELRTRVARSGLGITASGQLVWAAGEVLTPRGLAEALIRAGAVRAIELDINPWWVAGYLYRHGPTGPTPVPLVDGQRGVTGAFLKPYSRDFVTFVAG